MALSLTQKSIVTSILPALEFHGLEAMKVFYQNILTDYPTLQSLFSLSSQLTGRQAQALADALYAYAASIDDLSPILPVIERINQKHVSLGITTAQYAVVGQQLIRALIQVLGAEVFNAQIQEAWSAAYWQLANLMIKRENGIYSDHEAQIGGWTGWRKMRLARKIIESSEITSFYWTPVDGGVMPTFKPGQYIGVRVDVTIKIAGGQQIRQYSLSDAPTTEQAISNGHSAGKPRQFFRNSIKREQGVDGHPGLVSNVLHDTVNEGDIVEMTNPAGDFYLDTSTSMSAPLILISAGVGQTPLLSMLNTLTSMGSTRPITFIHTARDKATHAFAAHIKSLTASRGNLKSIVFHSRPIEDEVQGTDYDVAGRLNLGSLDAEKDLSLNDKNAEYFICGPGGFMMETAAWLAKRGADGERVKMEVFGTGNVSRRIGT